MTPAAVREHVGEPIAIEIEPAGDRSCFCYEHQEPIWWLVLNPLSWVLYPWVAAMNGSFTAAYDEYSLTTPAVLHFQDEKLARWEGVGGLAEAGSSCKRQETGLARVRAGETRSCAGGCSIRLEPSASSEAISLDFGAPVKVLGRSCQWCHVEDMDLGTKGWIGCEFLRPYGHPSLSPTQSQP